MLAALRAILSKRRKEKKEKKNKKESKLKGLGFGSLSRFL
jgi:hypothetical protein